MTTPIVLRRRPLAPALLLGALAGVAGLAFAPQPVPLPIPGDTQHMFAFAVIAWLARSTFPRAMTIAIVIALLALGATIEALQWAFTPRHAEWRDLISDGVGLFLASFLWAARARWASSARAGVGMYAGISPPKEV